MNLGGYVASLVVDAVIADLFATRIRTGDGSGTLTPKSNSLSNSSTDQIRLGSELRILWNFQEDRCFEVLPIHLPNPKILKFRYSRQIVHPNIS